MIDTNSFLQAIRDLNLELFLTILLTLILLIFGIWVGRYSLQRELKSEHYRREDIARETWWNNFWQGISTELFGAVITTIGFGIILLVFQQYQSIATDKADLILQMGSPNNAFAVEAVRVAGQKGWLFDGTLHEADLIGANLEGVDLIGAHLQGATLFEINLQGADIAEVHMDGADLRFANLQDTFAVFAIFVATDLRQTNLQNADLGEAILLGANLQSANLDNANLDGASLPDGTKGSEDTDMERFTDPNHPDFETTLDAINTIRDELGFARIN